MRSTGARRPPRPACRGRRVAAAPALPGRSVTRIRALVTEDDPVGGRVAPLDPAVARIAEKAGVPSPDTWLFDPATGLPLVRKVTERER